MLYVRVEICLLALFEFFLDHFRHNFIDLRTDNHLLFVLKQFQVRKGLIKCPVEYLRSFHMSKRLLCDDLGTAVNVFLEHLVHYLYHVVCVGFRYLLLGNAELVVKYRCKEHPALKQLDPGQVRVKHLIRESLGPSVHHVEYLHS